MSARPLPALGPAPSVLEHMLAAWRDEAGSGRPPMTVVERAVACWRLYASLYARLGHGSPWTKPPPQLVTEDGRFATGPAAEAFALELLTGWREARDRGVPPGPPPPAPAEAGEEEGPPGMAPARGRGDGPGGRHDDIHAALVDGEPLFG
jgi:hypothetical protein